MKWCCHEQILQVIILRKGNTRQVNFIFMSASYWGHFPNWATEKWRKIQSNSVLGKQTDIRRVWSCWGVWNLWARRLGRRGKRREGNPEICMESLLILLWNIKLHLHRVWHHGIWKRSEQKSNENSRGFSVLTLLEF